MTSIDKVFAYADHKIRTVTVDGDPRFVVADVCRVLDIVNDRQAAKRIDGDWVSQTDVLDGRGLPRKTNVVSEPGLYQLIFESDKAEAKKFARWVFEVVLPEIRRTGQYRGPAAAAEHNPFTYTLNEAAAILRQHYWTPVMSGVQLARQLRDARMFRQTPEPKARFASMFWFTGSSWNVQAFAIPEIAGRLHKTRTRMFEQVQFHGISQQLRIEGLGGDR